MLQMDLTKVVKECYNKIEEIFSKYGSNVGDIPKLPPYDSLKKNPELFYKYTEMYMNIGDEIICASISANLVLQSLQNIKATKLTPELTNNFTLMSRFREMLEEYIATLTTYRFDLGDLKRQVQDRVRLLQSISYNN